MQDTNDELVQAMGVAQSKLTFGTKNAKSTKPHRRGSFPTIAVGISHGGGQVVCLYCIFYT